jgi:hypothetical protein
MLKKMGGIIFEKQGGREERGVFSFSFLFEGFEILCSRKEMGLSDGCWEKERD